MQHARNNAVNWFAIWIARNVADSEGNRVGLHALA